ncbi:hypothetical protein ACLOJK_017042 [Asimina triloba]
MRLKKRKNQRKFVRFYKTCFGFREPFKVLCDGTFIHHLIQHSVDLSQLSKLLSAPTKLFITKCILGELRSLGDSHSDTVRTARTFLIARCDHESKRRSAANCIESVIGEDNSEHFFVATQDVDLRRKFKEVPGVPVIYGIRNSLFIDSPSMRQRKFIQTAEEERLHVSESEYNVLRKKVGVHVQNKSNEAGETLGKEDSTNQPRTKIDKARVVMGVADTQKFKRKRAKGPNPLSCKKKKTTDNGSSAQTLGTDLTGSVVRPGLWGPDDEMVSTSKRKRSRNRKRHKEGKLSDAGVSGHNVLLTIFEEESEDAG